MVPKLLLSSAKLSQRGNRLGCIFLDDAKNQWPPEEEHVLLDAVDGPGWMTNGLALLKKGPLALALPEKMDDELLLLSLGMFLTRGKVSHILLSSERDIELVELVLTSLEMVQIGVNIVSCPTCGRCKQQLEEVVEAVKSATAELTKPLTVAVMGCEVNGPGEARHADCGIAASAQGGVLFRKGRVVRKLEPSELAQALIDEVFELCEKDEQ